ncbi:MAG: hypothetical protein ACTSYA_13400 [Candidatus Kariarchaeaceae archaeon]
MNEEEFIKVTREYWKITPMSKLKEKIAIKRIFTQEELKKISLGHIPKDMDDKWFIYYESPLLFFHRSWNGVCVFQLKIEPINDCFLISEAWFTQDDDQFNVGNDLAFVIDLINALIDDRLLNR